MVSDGRLSSRKGSCRRMEGSVREEPRTEASRVTQDPGAEPVCCVSQSSRGQQLLFSTVETERCPEPWDPMRRGGLFLALQQLTVATEMENAVNQTASFNLLIIHPLLGSCLIA